MIWQFRQQMADGSTKLIDSFDDEKMETADDIELWYDTVKATNPLPPGASWLTCDENAGRRLDG